MAYPKTIAVNSKKMKKTLIVLAVLGVAGAANAQSNLNIYGSVDVNYAKETGRKTTMNSGDYEYKNFLGVMGSEDLGGGLKATFQLEKRFMSANGQGSSLGEFEGAANLGLAGALGHLRFGRVNELSTETYRLIDPFEQYGVAGMFESFNVVVVGNNGEGRLSNTVRYDSPIFNGFKLGTSYSVKGNDAAGLPSFIANDGWALSGTYTNGAVYLVANYDRAVNSLDKYKWNVGGAYAFGPARLSLGYEKSDLSSLPFLKVSFNNWIAGLSYKVGNGTIKASYNQGEMDIHSGGTIHNADYKQYGLGYAYLMSKRTELYANAMHYKRDGSDDSVSHNAIEFGLTHKF